jgi:hypothetical protein
LQAEQLGDTVGSHEPEAAQRGLSGHDRR